MTGLSPARRKQRTALDEDTAVDLAAAWLSAGRRVDMQGLADELGVTRMTLNRRVGSRERLIGEAMWRLAAAAWLRCQAADDAAEHRPDADLRSVRIIQAYNGVLVRSQGLRQMFDAEPELSLRVLTDPDGSIEPRSVGVATALLAIDEEAGLLRPIIDRESLAYALVKIAEAFLFSDLAVGRPFELVAANRLQAALITAGRTR